MEQQMGLGFTEMSYDEMIDTDGGAWWIVAGVVVGCAAMFGIGFYNGYKDTRK